MSASSRRSAGSSMSSPFCSITRSAFSVSACELTDTYSPAAIAIAPAARPATPARRTSPRLACAEATPITRLAVDTTPSLAPSTAARSHPMRWLWWNSLRTMPLRLCCREAAATSPAAPRRLLVVPDAADVAGDAGDERHLLRRLVRGRTLPHVVHRDHLALARHRHHLAAEGDAVDVVDVLDVAADLRRVDMRVHAAVVAGTEHIQVALMETAGAAVECGDRLGLVGAHGGNRTVEHRARRGRSVLGVRRHGAGGQQQREGCRQESSDKPHVPSSRGSAARLCARRSTRRTDTACCWRSRCVRNRHS